MHTTGTTTVRIFTPGGIPKAPHIVAQVAEAAICQGIEAVVIDTEIHPGVAIEVGVMALPAVIVERGGVEVARRECLRGGRGLRRWLDCRLVPVDVAPVFELTFA